MLSLYVARWRDAYRAYKIQELSTFVGPASLRRRALL
jgi:hypothetical protein